MSEVKHTPGPWTTFCCELGERFDGSIYAEDGSEDGRHVANIAKSERFTPSDKREKSYLAMGAEDLANARLIEAAPDLLRDARYVLEWWANHGSLLHDPNRPEPAQITNLRNSVAKAESATDA